MSSVYMSLNRIKNWLVGVTFIFHKNIRDVPIIYRRCFSLFSHASNWQHCYACLMNSLLLCSVVTMRTLLRMCNEMYFFFVFASSFTFFLLFVISDQLIIRSSNKQNIVIWCIHVCLCVCVCEWANMMDAKFMSLVWVCMNDMALHSIVMLWGSCASICVGWLDFGRLFVHLLVYWLYENVFFLLLLVVWVS